MTVAKVDATVETWLSSSAFSIQGYPTLLLIEARDTLNAGAHICHARLHLQTHNSVPTCGT